MENAPLAINVYIILFGQHRATIAFSYLTVYKPQDSQRVVPIRSDPIFGLRSPKCLPLQNG